MENCCRIQVLNKIRGKLVKISIKELKHKLKTKSINQGKANSIPNLAQQEETES